MFGLTLAQAIFVLIAVPAMAWAMAAIATSGGTRHSYRVLNPNCVWIHETATRHTARVFFVVLVAAIGVSAVWLVGLLG